jgi:polyhydroxybutyrate depolymerase
MQQAQISHAIAKSDAAGFVVVHPESSTSPGSWNAGACCDPAASAKVDDMGFLVALLDQLDSTLCVDDKRVYAMGLSNGGYMSYRIGCELADRVAAVGPVASGLAVSGCSPSRPVPLFAVHGTSDPLVQYSFDQTSVDEWSKANGCTTTATTYQNGDASCVTHGGCTAGADVVLCTIDGGGHQWPGGEPLPFLGKKSDDLITTDALWDFFVAHPLP